MQHIDAELVITDTRAGTNQSNLADYFSPDAIKIQGTVPVI